MKSIQKIDISFQKAIIFSSWITLNTSMPSHHVQWFKSFYIMYKHFYWNEKYIFPERYGQKLSKKSDVCWKKYLTRHTQSIYCCTIMVLCNVNIKLIYSSDLLHRFSLFYKNRKKIKSFMKMIYQCIYRAQCFFSLI